MANTRQAKKRIRQTHAKTEVNRRSVSRIRTFTNKVETAIAAGDKKGAEAAFAAAKPEIDRGVSKGVFKKNTAGRKISRLQKRINTLAS